MTNKIHGVRRKDPKLGLAKAPPVGRLPNQSTSQPAVEILGEPGAWEWQGDGGKNAKVLVNNLETVKPTVNLAADLFQIVS